MTKKASNIKINNEKPFNDLPLLPPVKGKIETVKVLRQLVKSSVALTELKGIAKILPNPNILLNAVILKEARASSEIENVITTQDKLYQALSAKRIQKKGFLNTNGIIEIQKILEENNAGIRKLPGTALRNAVTGKVIYTPPD